MLPSIGDVVWLPLKVTYVHDHDLAGHRTIEGTLPDGQRVVTNAPLNARPTADLARAPTPEAVLAVAGAHAPAHEVPNIWRGKPSV